MFDWILSVMQSAGYVGLFFLMLLENIFPPIPSELVIPLAGFLAATGEMSAVVGIFVAAIGATLGATLWYYLGLWIGADRLRRFAERRGKWIGLRRDDLDKADDWFQRHGGKAVFFGRMVPGIRTFISIPAGLAGMRISTFVGWTFLGSLLWTVFLFVMGYILEANYARVATWIDPVSTYVFLGLALAYIYNVFRR